MTFTKIASAMAISARLACRQRSWCDYLWGRDGARLMSAAGGASRQCSVRKEIARR